MPNLLEPDYAVLIDLFEKTRRKDPLARQQLKGWFDERAVLMSHGREARRQIGTLAYLISERQAKKNLDPGGRFDDLAHDPMSVAARHWERFQPFCEEIDRGVNKSVDDFVARVNALTKYVLLDLVEEAHRHDHAPLPVDPVDELDQDEGSWGGFVGSREQFQALRQVYQTLPPTLFLLMLLHKSCGLNMTQIAEILGTSAYHVKQDLARARGLLERMDHPHQSPGADARLV